MNESGFQIYARGLTWAMSALASAYLLLVLWTSGRALLEAPLLVAFLVAGGMAAAHLSSRRAGSRLPRLAITFVLAALVLIPAPGALLVAVASSLAGLGAGVVGPRQRGVAPFAVTAVAVMVGQAIYPLAVRAAPEAVLGGRLLALLVAYIVVQVFALALELLLETAAGPADEPGRPPWRTLALELSCLPLAWVLAELLQRRAWVEALIVSALVLVGEVTLLRLSEALGALRTSNHSLASRISELDTLHSIGREIVSSLDSSRVFAILERECRKIFPLDFCFVALGEETGSELKVVYRRRRGESARADETPLAEGLAMHVATRKQGLRTDDFDAEPAGSALRHGVVDPESRSALTVPLIIEERVIGVLSLQSRRQRAYDDHQLAVLTTIAQQAAVAIENARAYRQATVDSLTGFLLRDHFFKRLDEEYRRAKRYGATFSVLMIDLDGFKEINDRFGHLAGDQYLREVGATIRGELRGADLACRYGGDEFCLLLPETGLAGAQAIAERIRSGVAGRIVGVEGVVLRCTTSIGVAVYPRHPAGDAAGMLRNADEALYRAKRAGRDCVVPYAA
jgi:diguanylate cyclase (GGDEF)-like protein